MTFRLMLFSPKVLPRRFAPVPSLGCQALETEAPLGIRQVAPRSTVDSTIRLRLLAATPAAPLVHPVQRVHRPRRHPTPRPAPVRRHATRPVLPHHPAVLIVAELHPVQPLARPRALCYPRPPTVAALQDRPRRPHHVAHL